MVFCNVSACLRPCATWYNHSTQKYYCHRCAMKINKANHIESMEEWGHEICTLENEDTISVENVESAFISQGVDGRGYQTQVVRLKNQKLFKRLYAPVQKLDTPWKLITEMPENLMYWSRYKLLEG